MKRIAVRIISLGITVLVLAGLLAWPAPVKAAQSEWSAEVIPGIDGFILGPQGTGDSLDVRDWAVDSQTGTIYVAPGSSVAGGMLFKSINSGGRWETVTTGWQVDLVAIAPDDPNIVVIANTASMLVNVSFDGGSTWTILGTPTGAAGISDISVSESRSSIHYIAVGGWTTGNVASFWYLPYGQDVPVWHQSITGLASSTDVKAIEFSPAFLLDGTLLAVTVNSSTGIYLQLMDFDTLEWNSLSAYPDFPCTIVSTTGITEVQSASIAPDPDYDGDDETYRDVFIGLAISGTSAAVNYSGIYRFRDTAMTTVMANRKIHSVVCSNTYLMAGSYDDTTVYRITNPLGSYQTTRTSYSTKSPGGENRVLLAWLGSKLAAGTSGNESAFATSGDTGLTFTDVSLIDTKITHARDVSASSNNSRVFFVTDDSFDTSLWYKTSDTWTRVFSLKNSTGYIVRSERAAGSAVYLARSGTSTIYHNSAGGNGQWQLRNCNLDIVDMAVESYTILYALDSGGRVSKSANNGSTWSNQTETGLASGGTLTLISTGRLLVGSNNGYVAYSLDSAATWTKIPQSFGLYAGKMFAVADSNFASNHTIYAVAQTGPGKVMKWKIGTSNEWTSIFKDLIQGTVYGLAQDSNVLYVLEYSSSSGQSTLWRYMSPIDATDALTDWISITTTSITDANDATVALNASPQALVANSTKLWAVKTNGTNKLYSFNDFIPSEELGLILPDPNFVVRVNPYTSIANDIGFSWQRPDLSTQYELQLALDPDFHMLITTITVSTLADPAYVTLGPRQSGVYLVDFLPGTGYYWRVRITRPGYSLYSPGRSFTIEAPAAIYSSRLELLSPTSNALIEDTAPAFSWQALGDAAEYEFILSENITMASPLVNVTVAGTGLKLDKELTRGKTYFWQVRETKPVPSTWSAIGVFTVREYLVATASPTPVIKVPKSTPTVKYTMPTPTQTELKLPPRSAVPQYTVPGYLLVAILIGLVLAGTTIYLVVKNPRIAAVRAETAVRRPRRPVKETAAAPERPAPAAPPAEKKAPPVIIPAPPPADNLGLPAPPRFIPQAEQKTERPAIPGKSKEAEAVIFAAKSFMWITVEEKAGKHASDKEQEELGKKLAGRIKDLAKKERLYFRHPEDAALLFRIWARFGSRNETNHYIVDLFKTVPENAIRFIKCYLPPGVAPDSPDAADSLTRESYQQIAEVADVDKIYAALSKLFKFKHDVVEEKTPFKPADKNIAARFMRLHLQSKNAR